MKRLVRSGVVVLLAILLAGCWTVGQEFDQQALPEIEKGKTTRSQVQDWLGSPYEKGLQGQFETWTYRYIRFEFGNERNKELAIYFNKDGVVHTYSYTTNYSPWQISR
jgi:outer membrane protein assembly factor BamE (lipoprotein component of BamABCDE complex)